MMTVTSFCSEQQLVSSDGYLRYGVQYQNGRLIVPVTGMYFVYSFLELYENLDRKVNDKDATIRHGLYRFNVTCFKEEEIISSTYTRVNSSNGHFSYYNSYVSTNLELNAGEELSVKISDTSFLKYTDSNFFGVHLLMSLARSGTSSSCQGSTRFLI